MAKKFEEMKYWQLSRAWLRVFTGLLLLKKSDETIY